MNNRISKILDNLIQFEEKGLNSIWLKVFSNYFKVAIYEKFDFIIGNPAWVQWSVLPETYRNNVKDNIRLEGLFSSDKNVGGNNLNICALIANKSIERWLKDDGAFCFLMPRSILFNKSFEGFRNLKINLTEPIYFNEILDFSNAGEIFEGVGLAFCAFKITKEPLKNKDVVPISDYERLPNQKLNPNSNWNDAKKSFKVNEKFALALKTENNNNFLVTDNLQRAFFLKTKIGICAYKFRKGVNAPYFMRLKFIDFYQTPHLGVFHPYTKTNNRLKVDTSKKIILELDFIKPFITAPMLQEDKTLKWDNSYVIFPYFSNAKQPIPKEELKKIAPYIYHYLNSIDKHLNKGSNFNSRVQNLKENYGILRIGSYVYWDHFVCIRDNSKLSPCYISAIETHWNTATTPLFDSHISYVSERPVKLTPQEKYEPITQEEALYILEKLSDKDNQEIILGSQDERSISSRFPIKIPLYEK